MNIICRVKPTKMVRRAEKLAQPFRAALTMVAICRYDGQFDDEWCIYHAQKFLYLTAFFAEKELLAIKL